MSKYNDNTIRREAFAIKHNLDYRSLNIQRNYRLIIEILVRERLEKFQQKRN
jgi:hypothetical protein